MGQVGSGGGRVGGESAPALSVLRGNGRQLLGLWGQRSDPLSGRKPEPEGKGLLHVPAPAPTCPALCWGEGNVTIRTYWCWGLQVPRTELVSLM